MKNLGDVTQLVEYLFHAKIVIGSNPVITKLLICYVHYTNLHP